jgi:hypothetical protein
MDTLVSVFQVIAVVIKECTLYQEGQLPTSQYLGEHECLSHLSIWSTEGKVEEQPTL